MQRGFKSWCETVALAQRKNLGLRPYSPLSPWKLSEALEAKVIRVDQVPDFSEKYLKVLTVDDKESWSAVTISESGTNLIVLNSSHSEGRINSDLMHELAHIIVGHKAYRMDVSEGDLMILSTYNKEQEDEAGWLAGCLLLPRKALEHIYYNKYSTDTVMSEYGVSKQMYDFRTRMTGVNRQFTRTFKARA